MSKSDGGRAFPASDNNRLEQGMTLRDYFAAAALQGYVARGSGSSNIIEWGPKAAYKLADAMLKEREK